MKIIVAEYAEPYNKKASTAFNIKGIERNINDDAQSAGKGANKVGDGSQSNSKYTLKAGDGAPGIMDACPRIWMKADSALLKGGKPVFLPDWTQDCSATLCLWARIKHMGKSIPARFAHRYYDQLGVGVDFTAEDVLRRLKEAGEPWEKAKSFDGSAVIGQPLAQVENQSCSENTEAEFVADKAEHTPQTQAMTLALTINREKKVETIINNVDEALGYAIENVSRFFTLREGDYLFLSPAGIEHPKVEIDDHIACSLNKKVLTEFNVK